MSKAVIFFAPGLEECEGLLCVDLLRRSGVEVTIAAVGGEKIVKSARSISVVADALAEELDYSAFDAAILPWPQSAPHRLCWRRSAFCRAKRQRFTPAWKIN